LEFFAEFKAVNAALFVGAEPSEVGFACGEKMPIRSESATQRVSSPYITVFVSAALAATLS
jgi:hypothetical protein